MRYVVRESKGVRVAFNNPGGSAPVAEVMVLDSWYCYTFVWDSVRDSSQHGARARREGHRLCAQWNAEHDAALAGEAAPPLKGKGSR